MADKSRKKTFSVRAALGQRNAKNRDITNNPQATSQTSLNSSTSAVNSKPSLEWTKYFLDESLLSLSPKERNIITEYIAPDTQDVRTAFDQTYDAALRQKQFCDDQALVLRFRGHSLTVKDKAAKIVSWLDRFKFVGGMAVNIDPIHFGLPWAAFSIILEVLRSPLIDDCRLYELTRLGPRGKSTPVGCNLEWHGFDFGTREST